MHRLEVSSSVVVSPVVLRDLGELELDRCQSSVLVSVGQHLVIIPRSFSRTWTALSFSSIDAALLNRSTSGAYGMSAV